MQCREMVCSLALHLPWSRPSRSLKASTWALGIWMIPGRASVFLRPQTQPIHELLRHANLGILEAKRQNLQRALDQYLMEFNACRCGPCFNNGVPILEGTSCKCQCPLGRKGLACELMEQQGKARASSLTSKPNPAQRGQHGRALGFQASLSRALLPLALRILMLSLMADPAVNGSYPCSLPSRPSLE